MVFVLDSSVAMSRCFDDETTPFTEVTLGLLAHSATLVPLIWPLEVANVLLTAERRGRIRRTRSARFPRLLRALPISVDSAQSEPTRGDLLELARAYHLSVHDASCLELATREELPLATLDARLWEAGRRAGVDLLE